MNRMRVDGYRKIVTSKDKKYYARIKLVGDYVHILRKAHKTASGAIAYGNKVIERYVELKGEEA